MCKMRITVFIESILSIILINQLFDKYFSFAKDSTIILYQKLDYLFSFLSIRNTDFTLLQNVFYFPQVTNEYSIKY